MEEVLIAPCGMNCGICSSYLALKQDIKSRGIRMPYCSGCRSRNKQCAFIKKRCGLLTGGLVQYCYECKDFPCANLLRLDKKYRACYRMSMVENLECIKAKGIQQLIDAEKEKWRCPECGQVICCHNGICFACGLDRLRDKQKKYRWEDD